MTAPCLQSLQAFSHPNCRTPVFQISAEMTVTPSSLRPSSGYYNKKSSAGMGTPRTALSIGRLCHSYRHPGAFSR